MADDGLQRDGAPTDDVPTAEDLLDDGDPLLGTLVRIANTGGLSMGVP
jgi:hypothetical protein